MPETEKMESLESCKNFGSLMDHLYRNKGWLAVPDYQRTYAWEKKHAETLWEDLQRLNNDESYFLGLFLLEQDERIHTRYCIIDGQQRFTTLFMFLHLIHKKFPHFNDLTNFIKLDGILRLKLQKEQNDEFFKEILAINANEIQNYRTEYFSQENIKSVLCFVAEKVFSEDFSEDVALKTIKSIKDSKILVHLAHDTGQAMQIFELLNDRGKGLTQLESLKSYIMHQVYIKSNSSNLAKEDHIATIKKNFTDVYRVLNKINNLIKGDFHEDNVLRYHFVAFENWQSQKDYRNVSECLKKSFYEIDSIDGLKAKTKEIVKSFELIHQIIDKAHNPITNVKWLKNLYILDRMATFYPLLISLENRHPKILNEVCNYLELFTYRAFGLLNKRTDAALHAFYTLARDITYSNLEEAAILNKIKSIMNEYIGQDTQTLFENNLEDYRFYHNQPGIDGRYILVKYENNLVEKETRGYEKRLISGLDEITNFQKTTKDSLSIEHVVAQDLVESDPEYIRLITQGANKDSHSTDWWKKSEFRNYRENIFSDRFLHSLGNLVISKIGANSGKSNEKPDQKNWSSFRSQEEIRDLININKNKRGDNFWLRDSSFNVDTIKERQKRIVSFAKDYWSYKYFDPESEEEHFDINKREPLI